MNAYYVCQQKFFEDVKTKNGPVRYLTIDNGWHEFIEFAAIHKQNHAKYLAEKHQLSVRDYRAKFFTQKAKDD